ncbi:LysR substrate-binding domain-containing protein [Bradyrhizobium canariense]|uniref:LysR family transcriptional regulator, regulator of gene expression of beta-lactamase n=1 Tax=Bradyrhizobium canariense TaxID=255045 RepID=A0A1H1WB98_9BRAD|nr:LysR substrate-binding domain-containing protein [Bradyrhizobium canariense]SDS93409.1 LysR family transcriptional regulator, regulator of gene expression of beta-lactamase [Bradyrhizobium canariense]
MGRSAQPSARALSALSLFATCGTLTEAAEHLGVTRSALSHRIAALEKQLGVALVRKAGRRIALTEDGERLLASVGDALDRIETAVQPFRRDRGQIRLSTVATFASHWLIPRIPIFQAQHPQIEVAIFTTTRPVDLKKEEMDCAIRHGRGAWKGLASTLLFEETLMPVASPDVADRLSSNAKQGWSGAPLIRARSRFMDWSSWQKHDRAFAGRRIKWLTVETRAQALDAAMAGAGVALMDMAYIATPVTEGRLKTLAECPLQLQTGYYFVHLPNARNLHLLTLLRDWAVEAARPFRTE